MLIAFALGVGCLLSIRLQRETHRLLRVIVSHLDPSDPDAEI